MGQADSVTRREAVAAIGAAGLALLGVRAAEGQDKKDKPPEGAKEGCWIDVYADEDLKGAKQRFWGPRNYTNLRGDPDWGDRIGSVVVGPNAIVFAYEDENYGDTEICFGPNQKAAKLGELNFNDDIDSMKILFLPQAPQEAK